VIFSKIKKVKKKVIRFLKLSEALKYVSNLDGQEQILEPSPNKMSQNFDNSSEIQSRRLKKVAVELRQSWRNSI